MTKGEPLMSDDSEKWNGVEARLTIHIEVTDRDDLLDGITVAVSEARRRVRAGKPCDETSTFCAGGHLVRLEYAP